MADDEKTRLRLKIAHVLFIDIVGYSKLSIDEQQAAIERLNDVVQSTEEFRKGDGTGRLVKIPTGDGMALVFFDSPEAPVECALEISRALAGDRVGLRMGINSGPVSGVVDVNGRANVAGEGINAAQRVMNCGDSGHILLSKRVADDLAQFKHWRPHLHELGDCEVKHGKRIGLVNLFTSETGNSDRPTKLESGQPINSRAIAGFGAEPRPNRWWWIVGLALVVALVSAAFFVFYLRGKSRTSTAKLPEKSIAVLPFENRSEDKTNEYFADGVQDEILTRLSKIADLKVISRTSVMQYKSGAPRNLREIGRELGVAHVLEGSVQRATNEIRVNAQLIDVRTEAHLWANTYDRDLADVFAIQSEIAKAIAEQLQAKLSPNEKRAIEQPPTTDLAAFDLYSRAKALLFTTAFSAVRVQNLEQAIELLDQAVAHDPSFFDAYCQLASAHDQIYAFAGDHTAARLARAEAALQAAFRLQPESGEAHLARAGHLYRGYLDYPGALAELEIAHRTLPNDPRIPELSGYITRRQGKQEEAVRHLERAIELDPRNYFTLQQISLSYMMLQRRREQAAVLDRVLAIRPDDAETKATRALVELDWKADTHPLHRAIEEIAAKNPADVPRVANTWFLCTLAERDSAAGMAALAALRDGTFGDNAMRLNGSFGQGLLARAVKDETKARAAFTAARVEQEKMVQTQPDYGPALCVLALIDAGLGRKEEALAEGRRAVELLPVEKDSINGAGMVEFYAIIAAWVGEKDLACEQLTRAVQLHSFGVGYGRLRLFAYWDPLRGDPRFEQIVNSLAPK